MARAPVELEQPRAAPAYLRAQRAVLAACILLAPLALAGWFTLCPQYGDPACPNNTDPYAVFAAFRAANPALLRAFWLVNLVVPYLYPLSYLGLGMVAMRRAPWWSTLGIASGWLGSIAWGFIADAMLQLGAALQIHQDAIYAAIVRAYFTNPLILSVAAGWVLGHLLAYVLLGIALLRARTVPAWAGWALIASAPLMGPLAYGLQIGLLQVLGYVLVFIGSIPAAWAMIRRT
jgi:hypothetical protein